MDGVLSKGITFKYDSGSSTSSVMTAIEGLQSCPSLGASYDKVEITTLADAFHRFMNGLKSYDDLSFRFLYDNSGASSNYRVAKGIENAVKDFEVDLPDGTKFEFTGQASVDLDAAEVNQPLTFTLSIALQSDIAVTNPTT